MNWRTIVGIIISFAAVEKMVAIFVDSVEDESKVVPYYVWIVLIVVALVGFILIVKGAQKSVKNKQQ